MEKYSPSLITRFNCRSTRWAVYNQPYKMIRIENIRDEIYHYIKDPQETKKIKMNGKHLNKLQVKLDEFLASSSIQTEGCNMKDRGFTTNLTDEKVLQRLRNLGYID